MSKTTLYHNQQCSKSRAALAILEASGIVFTTRLYLEEQLSSQEIEQLLAMLGLPPRALIRAGEAMIKDRGIDIENLEDAALIALMTLHPILIERPLLVHDGRATIGRPIENVRALIGVN